MKDSIATKPPLPKSLNLLLKFHALFIASQCKYLTLYVVLIISYISVLFYMARNVDKKFTPIAIEESQI